MAVDPTGSGITFPYKVRNHRTRADPCGGRPRDTSAFM
jgi:hypothetical protein